MTDDSPAVARARRRADEARERLMTTIDELLDYGHSLQQKLAPSHLAKDAWEAAKSKSVDLAEDAVDAVRSRPVAATGAVALLAAFIAREPLIDLAGRLMKRKSKKPAAQAKGGKVKDKTETINA
jgi:hypothetical protein